MLTLTLDTSTHRGTVALSFDSTVLGECSWDKATSHSEQMVGEVQKLYHKFNKNLSETSLIICGIGPGSFTGLRVALSFAKTLASGLKIPVVAVENCWAIALNSKITSAPVLVVLDAQKNKYFVGEYLWQDSFLSCSQDVRLADEDDVLKRIHENTLCISNVPDFFLKHALTLSTIEPFPSAKLIFEQVTAHKDKHEQIQWEELRPLYLRASAAEEVFLQKKKN